jgi:hypothetical protein
MTFEYIDKTTTLLSVFPYHVREHANDLAANGCDPGDA